ncbi:MAG: DUF1501 domain-containing protein [Planctomycetota bacterium]|nr:MAG: DUF1501 domain-containing protein [Planctomycetota bacterium]
MDPHWEQRVLQTRRQFFGRAASGIGAAALASLLNPSLAAGAIGSGGGDPRAQGVHIGPHFAPTAKRIIYLFQSGAPSQLDLFDYKPKMREYFNTELPESIRMGQRLTTMTSGQASFPVAPTAFKFAQHGNSRAWVSDLMPRTASIADDLCFIKSVHTEAINHDPGITFMQTGSQIPGRPSMGAWLNYGLGAENADLPGFIVLISQGSAQRASQALYSRLWGTGFLPSEHQGVQFRGAGDAVLYLSNPDGVDRQGRRRALDAIAKLNARQFQRVGDPEINARVAAGEMAFRMQTSVPDLTDLSDEPDTTFEMYGENARKPGTYAANCLLARRLAERGVRFIQLYHRGWDQHGNLPSDIRLQCGDTDQASAALVMDLKRRGLLEDTLVVWGGEFGRTIYSQGALSETNYGRDHHPRCFTVWMAGGGIKPGMTYGQTDDFSYNVVDKPVHVHDLNATILHCLGMDHTRLTYPFQGRDFRLTDVHGRVVKDILA